MTQPTLMLALAALLGALSTGAQAQKPAADAQLVAASAPGKGVVARTVTLTASVEAIDVAQRQVTLKGPQGKVVTLAAGPDVRNLDQVKVGDQVKVAYVEALSLELKKGGKELPSSAAATDAARAAKGDRPGGIVADQVKVTADVTAVDTKTKMVTLRGPKQTVDLHVADPAQLKLIKVGDQVEAVYTQALALSVEPAAPAKK